MRIIRNFAFAALGSVLLIGTASASQIGQFLENGGGNLFMWTNSAAGVTFTTVNPLGAQVFWQYDGALATPLGASLRTATFSITATTTQTAAVVGGTNIQELGFAGSFSIIDNILGTNLLSGTFNTGGTLGGALNGNNATFQDATPPASEVVFTSSYLDFSGSTTSQAFALSLSNVSPNLSINANSFMNSANGAATGTFSAQPSPQVMPEPATMALLGSALMALGIFGRKRFTN
jgi:hypothetical protein